MSWHTVTIGQIVGLQRGHDLPEAVQRPGDFPIIGSAGPNGTHDEALAPGPGVTIGRCGGSIGKVTFVPSSYWPHNTCLYVTDFKGNNPRFIALLLSRLDLAQLNSGAAQPSLNRNFVYPVTTRIPGIAEQEKIAAAIDGFDDLIANNRRRMALLEQAARLLYDEWFVRLRFPGHEGVRVVDGVPEGWARVRLDTIANVNSQTLAGSFDGEIEYVDISSVSPGQIDSSTTVDFREAPSRARRPVRPGDILWSCVRPNRRSHALAWTPPANLVASTGFAVLRATGVPPTFLYQAVTTDAFVGYLENHARGAAYPAVGAADFERAELLVPPQRILQAYDRVASPIAAQRETLMAQCDKLRTARDLLLPRLMSGEIEL